MSTEPEPTPAATETLKPGEWRCASCDTVHATRPAKEFQHMCCGRMARICAACRSKAEADAEPVEGTDLMRAMVVVADHACPVTLAKAANEVAMKISEAEIAQAVGRSQAPEVNTRPPGAEVIARATVKDAGDPGITHLHAVHWDPATAVNQWTVELLEHTLAEAKAGKVVSVVLVTIDPQDQPTVNYTHCGAVKTLGLLDIVARRIAADYERQA
jgi:hypothetical protein